MSETIEDVKRRNKRLVEVLHFEGWSVSEQIGTCLGPYILAECDGALIHLYPLGRFKKPYWLVVYGYRATTFKYEDSLLKRLGYKS